MSADGQPSALLPCLRLRKTLKRAGQVASRGRRVTVIRYKPPSIATVGDPGRANKSSSLGCGLARMLDAVVLFVKERDDMPPRSQPQWRGTRTCERTPILQ